MSAHCSISGSDEEKVELFPWWDGQRWDIGTLGTEFYLHTHTHTHTKSYHQTSSCNGWVFWNAFLVKSPISTGNSLTYKNPGLGRLSLRGGAAMFQDFLPPSTASIDQLRINIFPYHKFKKNCTQGRLHSTLLISQLLPSISIIFYNMVTGAEIVSYTYSLMEVSKILIRMSSIFHSFFQKIFFL